MLNYLVRNIRTLLRMNYWNVLSSNLTELITVKYHIKLRNTLPILKTEMPRIWHGYQLCISDLVGGCLCHFQPRGQSIYSRFCSISFIPNSNLYADTCWKKQHFSNNAFKNNLHFSSFWLSSSATSFSSLLSFITIDDIELN